MCNDAAAVNYNRLHKSRRAKAHDEVKQSRVEGTDTASVHSSSMQKLCINSAELLG